VTEVVAHLPFILKRQVLVQCLILGTGQRSYQRMVVCFPSHIHLFSVCS